MDIKNDDMRIEIEYMSLESFQRMLINEESERPKMGVARFRVSLNPPVIVTRKILIYSDGRVYLDD